MGLATQQSILLANQQLNSFGFLFVNFDHGHLLVCVFIDEAGDGLHGVMAGTGLFAANWLAIDNLLLPLWIGLPWCLAA